jgi:hypothetical protein
VIAASGAKVDANIAAITKTWEAYMATSMTPEEVKLAKAFADDRKLFVQEGLKPAVAALRANNVVEAQRVVVEKIRPLFIPVDKAITALIQLPRQRHSTKRSAWWL